MIALHAIVAAQEARLIGEIVKTLGEQRTRHIIALAGDGFAAEQVADDQLQAAAARLKRDAGHVERARRELAAALLHIVDIDVDDRGHFRAAADAGQRHRHIARADREVARELDAGEAYRRRRRAARGDAVAEPE